LSISPWNGDVEVSSPNGEFVAKVVSTHEIAMGAPVSGMLFVNGKAISKRCSSSIVWSNDSRFIAFPEWTWSNNQKLKILNVQSGKIKKLFKAYRVLELEGFNDLIISGVDSPIYKPKNLNVKLREF
jgi:hypothetical protein